jgi:hypothetical protein
VSNRKPKRFFVTLTAEIEISRDILKTAKRKAWAKQFYTFTTDEEVAMFVGRLLTLGASRVDQIEGFADKPNDATKLIELRAEEATEDGQ